MDCTVDIKKDGNVVLAYLPFNPRTEFGIPKGSVYVNCIIDNFKFKSKLLSRGSGKYCILFNKKLLKDIGIGGGEKSGVRLSIEPETVTVSIAEEKPEMPDNEVLKAIRERASIRRFRDKGVDRALLNAILYAGLCAPSATNKRPFHFIVSQDREKMARIIGSNPYVKMLESSVACIIVCGDNVVQGIPEWLVEDCSAATQNMLLAIHSIGLGGVWCGVKQGLEFYKNIVREFNLPNYIRPVSLIAVGWPDMEKTQPNRFEANKIHFEAW